MENRTVEKTYLICDIHRPNVKTVLAFVTLINFLGTLFLFQDPLNAVVGSSTEDRQQYGWALQIPFRRPGLQRLPMTDIDLVVASTKADNTSWLDQFLADWPKSIYIVDDSTAGLSVPQNKGHEAMPYLTYANHPFLQEVD